MTATQLELVLPWEPAPPVAAPPADLTARLRAVGIPPSWTITVHRNRRVMISMDREGGLRVHAGYAWAPDLVIAALARWARPRISRRERREAARIFLAFPVHRFVAPPPVRRRPSEIRAGDRSWLEHLTAAHEILNRRWFEGRLRAVPIRLSSRMRRKLGHYDPGGAGVAAITLSRRHLRRDSWSEVVDTLLHEMVHQWQDETGRPVDHGSGFRAMARAVGIEPRAVRRDVPHVS